MERIKQIKELKNKIQVIEKKITIEPNSCSMLQNENVNSLESDRKYLEYLKEELKKIEDGDYQVYGVCELCGGKIEPLRLKINPSTKRCARCK